jgi:transcriptional regulator with XRE-family HTH domain
MDTLKSRIEYLINKHAGGNKSQFATLIGTSEANVRNYVSGKSKPKIEIITSISKEFEITYEWILEGLESTKPKQQEKGNVLNVTKNVTLNVTKPKQQEKGNKINEDKIDKNQNNKKSYTYAEELKTAEEAEEDSNNNLFYEDLLDKLEPSGISLYILRKNERFKDDVVFNVMLEAQKVIAGTKNIQDQLDELRKEVTAIKVKQ